MLRLPALLRQLNLESEWETVENPNDVPIEMLDASQLVTDTADDDNAGTDGQDEDSNGESPSSMVNTDKGKDTWQNLEILKHLFQVCPATLLASCRLVCRLWYDESLVSWRSTAPINVSTPPKQTDIFVGQRTLLRDFLEFTHQPENKCSKKPHRSIRIQRSIFVGSPTSFGVLWEAIGSNLSSLTLSCCEFNSADELRQTIFTCCPILKKLDIIQCRFPPRIQTAEERDEEYIREYKEPIYGEHKLLKSLNVDLCQYFDTWPLSWFELFSHFPSLSSLECRASPSIAFPEAEFQSLIKGIRAIRRNDMDKLPLKHFQINPYLTILRDPSYRHRFDLVNELLLPLWGCIIEVHPKMDTEFVKNTLQDLAPYLKTIVLDLDEKVRKAGQVLVPTLSQDFPVGVQLDKLTRLESRGDLIGTFEFLNYTPNLSELDIYDVHVLEVTTTKTDFEGGRKRTLSTMAISHTCEEKLANLQMAHLATLKLGFRVSDGDIIFLFKWMPNITNLQMFLNDEQFGMVCRKWRNLRTLTVHGDMQDKLLTEEGVTGIKSGKDEVISPDIANLEGLESLVLEIVKLTPESVLYLFMQLPALKTLDHGLCCRDTPPVYVNRRDLDLSAYQHDL